VPTLSQGANNDVHHINHHVHDKYHHEKFLHGDKVELPPVRPTRHCNKRVTRKVSLIQDSLESLGLDDDHDFDSDFKNDEEFNELYKEFSPPECEKLIVTDTGTALPKLQLFASKHENTNLTLPSDFGKADTTCHKTESSTPYSFNGDGSFRSYQNSSGDHFSSDTFDDNHNVNNDTSLDFSSLNSPLRKSQDEAEEITLHFEMASDEPVITPRG
jgi:hypothetical protein